MCVAQKMGVQEMGIFCVGGESGKGVNVMGAK